MKRNVILAVAALVFSSLACMQENVTATPEISVTNTVTPSVTSLPPTQTATVPTSTPSTTARVAIVTEAMINVHSSPEGAVIGYLKAGDNVIVLGFSDDGKWVQIDSPAGYVWRGCLSDNPDKLGCEAR